MKSIDVLELSVRTYNVLRRAGITTIDELLQKDRDELIRIRNLSKKTLEEITMKLEAFKNGGNRTEDQADIRTL